MVERVPYEVGGFEKGEGEGGLNGVEISSVAARLSSKQEGKQVVREKKRVEIWRTG